MLTDKTRLNDFPALAGMTYLNTAAESIPPVCVPEALARNLLVQSFIGEALEEISDEVVRQAITDQVVHWLPAACYLAEEWRAE